MLTIHFSHRYETLARLLAERLAAPGRAGWFAADQVVVPSAAVRRQLTLELARRHGVCANVEFAYLARWLWQAIARVVTGVGAESPFDPALLVWRLYGALAARPWAHHPRLYAYLAAADDATRHELAVRLAGLFDQYVAYRPDWLDAWSRDALLDLGPEGSPAQADQAWQAELWRGLARDVGAAAPARAFVAALQARGAALVADGTLPAELHVFALPAIAPLHIGLLQALGACTEVHVYALNPCREYWFEIVEPRRLAHLAARGRAGYHEVGNRLLGAWGVQARASLALLVDACGERGVEDAHFDDDADGGGAAGRGTTLLEHVQRAILEMRELAPASVEVPGYDRSIEVHACHSLARELDVLQDRLLGLFAAEDPPAPHDILVVTPDLDAAAPLIDALFSTAPRERRIPYQISGRRRTALHGPARAFTELLALAGSRGTASAVFGLLQQPVVARRFGLDVDALDRVRGWLQDAGVHWALDDADCASLGLPAGGGHDFATGLARLLLGYALPTHAAEPFEGTLARGAAEGASDTAALGALWRFVDALAALRRDIAQAPLPPAAWTPRLMRALADFVEPSDDELEAMQDVRAALQSLAHDWLLSGCSVPLSLDVVRSAVAAALDDPARGGVPTGAVTFASMSALRGLPYRVVCAIGLNDGVFPSAGRPAEFDLMAAPGQARAGDRQRRTDERNVFLDLLLAARQTLHLSYVGRSVRDNSSMPPSVLVSELLDTLLGAVARATPERFVVVHPLQAFALEAFRSGADQRVRSFDAELAEALRRRAAAPAALVDESCSVGEAEELDDDGGAAEPAQPFFTEPLPAPDDAWLDVSLDQLIEFFGHPARALLRRRLGVRLARADVELADDEPFVADLPARSALAARLLPALLGGASLDDARRLATAGTELPAGAFGARALEAELGALAGFAERLRGHLSEPALPPVAVALDIDAAGRRWQLRGTLTDLRARGVVGYRFDELRAHEALRAWLQHLLLCATAPDGVARRSTWIARDETVVLGPCAQAREQLAHLLELYAQGLVGPLAFYPKAAWAFASQGWKLSAARSKWNGSPFSGFGERKDAAWRLALRGRPDPFAGPEAPEFERLARTVFEPMLACREGE